MTTTTQRDFKSFGNGYLPGLVGVEIVTVSREVVESRMAVRREVMAPNGFLHAASVIALADTSCGYGCVATLPEGAKGFTTIEPTGAKIALFRCTQMVLWQNPKP